MITELYRGLWPFVARQSITMVVFLQADLLAKKITRRVLNIPDDQKISVRSLTFASGFVAVATTLIGTPVDVLKTYL